MTGWRAVQEAASRAMRDPRPDPQDPREPCEAMLRELDDFYADPMTQWSGMGGEMSPLIAGNHIKRHACQGWGDDR